MKNNYIILLISTLTFGLLIGCNDNDDPEDECIANIIEYVTSVDSPATGMVNQTIPIEVKFGVGNGCGDFGKFIETENGNIRNIEIEAKYIGCMCTQDAPIRTVIYEFTPNVVGNYQLNFKSSPTGFTTVNLTIN